MKRKTFDTIEDFERRFDTIEDFLTWVTVDDILSPNVLYVEDSWVILSYTQKTFCLTKWTTGECKCFDEDDTLPKLSITTLFRLMEM